MRWVHIAIVVLFAVGTLVFALQNLQTVTLTFLGFSARAPLAVIVPIVYLLGMATGGSLFSLLRRSVVGARLIGA